MPSSKQQEQGSEGEFTFLTFKLDLIKTDMINRADAAYEALCGLDVRKLRVLRIICAVPGVTASSVARQSLIEKTLLSKLLAELMRRKLVRRTVHPDDARHFQLWPTPAGLRVRDQAHELGKKLEDEMLSALLTPDERRLLGHLVDKLMVMFVQDAAQDGPPAKRRS
ncbi:MarR family winged helix-turn-helix transcriptional regulator [Bordetella sp. FB-8]|uniref:MarR family winged helix-turn-helix transcriptional regulator n=1 Tax=Bordetella sp. FB-8 TaxID=1159870 RepID=UPI00036BC8A9|nr:MarR family winged helix-turn-helix transcriptional regulator [Bordetella sp. FB-8]